MNKNQRGQTKNKMTDRPNPTMSIFMVNVNGIYTQKKKAENSIIAIIKKQDLIIF